MRWGKWSNAEDRKIEGWNRERRTLVEFIKKKGWSIYNRVVRGDTHLHEKGEIQ